MDSYGFSMCDNGIQMTKYMFVQGLAVMNPVEGTQSCQQGVTSIVVWERGGEGDFWLELLRYS